MLSKRNPLVIIALALMKLSLGCSIISRPIGESTPTYMVEIIPTETPSAIPTLSIAELKANALILLENNGDCMLPCIWGLTPGSTTTSERQKILASYGKFSGPDFSVSGSDESVNPGGFGMEIIKDNVSISVGLSYYETDNLVEILSLATTSQKDGMYVFGDNNYSELLNYYTLPQLLSNYGLPSDVLVIAFPYDPFLKADYEPFSIVVIYSNLGIMAEYISPTQWIGEMVELPTPNLWVGEITRGCPSQGYLTLRTWDVRKNISIKRIASIAAGEGMSETAYDYYAPIQEATSMSINEFYNTFKQPNNTQCLDVLSNLWLP